MVVKLPTAEPIVAALATIRRESTRSLGPSVAIGAPISSPLIKTLWEELGLVTETIPFNVTAPALFVTTFKVMTLSVRVAGRLVKVSRCTFDPPPLQSAARPPVELAS